MKTSKGDFAMFKAEFMKWVNIFGLKGWRIVFEHKDIESNAQIVMHIVNRTAVVTLATDVESPDQILMSAFHEADELRYARIRALAGNRDWDEEMFTEALHDIIRQDESIIFSNKQ